MTDLTQDTAKKLATRVAKESDGIVRFGKTNGRICLHIRVPAKPAAGDDIGKQQQAGSETVYSVAEWDNHRWNRNNKPRKKKQQGKDELFVAAAVNSMIDAAIGAAIRNQEAI